MYAKRLMELRTQIEDEMKPFYNISTSKTYTIHIHKMKNSFSIFALLMIAFIHAQTNRFIYELQYKMDSTDMMPEKLNMVLDIGPKEVKFYGQNLAITDSLNKNSG